ncbi:hypothetical protein BCR34DRAFT_584616 [Clohesyomyces aquaticus]|uniref:Uncharacterized protein n=1 Tax=Clohesyomyces aquaticus TaxID=1231657 RepID=A0A1Y2A183_9PLEO|nr:hypothetical protein BCR34DRAFT_584616 [Clohesyomyces aquaticus]
MNAAAVASWQQCVAKSCKEVKYKDTEDPATSGCGAGIVNRGSFVRALMTPEERRATLWGTPWKKRTAVPEPICDNCNPPPPPECHYKAKICSGPDHISNARNGPYASHMNIQLDYSIGHLRDRCRRAHRTGFAEHFGSRDMNSTMTDGMLIEA